MRIDEQWLLTDREFNQRLEQVRLAVASGEVRDIRRQLVWWRKFHQGLGEMIMGEVEYWLEHQDEYGMPLEEVPYYVRWNYHQEEADAVISGIKGALRYVYERG
jgi:hypothetical protein